MTSAKRKKKIYLSHLWAHLTGTSHLPARGQSCDRCGTKGHLTCWEVLGPDIEHLAVELHNIERRAA